jgi:hypothetical protein
VARLEIEQKEMSKNVKKCQKMSQKLWLGWRSNRKKIANVTDTRGQFLTTWFAPRVEVFP